MRVYIASCTHHAARWVDLRGVYPTIQFTASWPDKVLAGVEETPGNAAEFWTADIQEIRGSSFLICYGEPSDILRGALVEAGVAIAHGVPVLVVGDCGGFGSWVHCPGVRSFRGTPAEVLPSVLEHLATLA